MVVTLDSGRVLEFSFAYSSANGVSPASAGPLRLGLDNMAREMNRRLSYAEVADVTPTASGEKTYNAIASAVAVCHEKDTFVRSKGRKTAVTNVLKAASMPDATNTNPLTYNDRKQVWKVYADTFGFEPR